MLCSSNSPSHLTPASSLCWQLDSPMATSLAQSSRELSSPSHTRLSRRMEPLPSPKPDILTGMESAYQIIKNNCFSLLNSSNNFHILYYLVFLESTILRHNENMRQNMALHLWNISQFPLYPSCVQTTLASSSSQKSSHTVPYALL